MIHVTDNWYIDADEGQYVLKEKTNNVDKKGNVLYKNNMYYPTVEMALTSLNRICQKQFVKENDIEIKQLLDEFKYINSKFEDLLQGIKESEEIV